MPTELICMLCMILIPISFLNSFNWLEFVMKNQRLLCEAGSEFSKYNLPAQSSNGIRAERPGFESWH
jgi:hypothetical protein